MTLSKYSTLISPNRRLLLSKASHQRIVVLGALIVTVLLITYTLTVHRTNLVNFEPNVISSYPKYNETELQKIETSNKCFRSDPSVQRIVRIPDVLEHDVKPEPGKSIFFHVTTCQLNGSVILNARQACAIESAAKWNPNRTVFVLFAAPVGFPSNETIPPTLNVLRSFPNIHFRNLNIIKYSIGTPGEAWIKTDRIYLSKFIVAHMADYLRFLTLYKFGGIYFDLDVIVLKNLDGMPPNFSGAESGYWTAIGAMGFEPDNVGHKIIDMISRENIESFLPDEWASSGVGAITRIVQKICHTNYTFEAKPEFCWGFKLFSPSTFYPIHWSIWQYLFSTDPKIVSAALILAKDSITAHAWNKISEKQIIDKSERTTAYGTLAQMNCPGVFEASGPYF